jgi:hypothetical protein
MKKAAQQAARRVRETGCCGFVGIGILREEIEATASAQHGTRATTHPDGWRCDAAQP